MRCIFLPPYSPDYNPIELAFSAIKSRIRRWGSWLREVMTEAMNDGDLDYRVIDALSDAVFAVTPEDALGWFKGCHYV